MEISGAHANTADSALRSRNIDLWTTFPNVELEVKESKNVHSLIASGKKTMLFVASRKFRRALP
jgi:hypothetical protein